MKDVPLSNWLDRPDHDWRERLTALQLVLIDMDQRKYNKDRTIVRVKGGRKNERREGVS